MEPHKPTRRRRRVLETRQVTAPKAVPEAIQPPPKIITVWDRYTFHVFSTEGLLPHMLVIYRTKSRSATPKPIRIFAFSDVEKRMLYLHSWKAQKVAEQEERAVANTIALAAQVEQGHSLEVGTCLYASWGYDQTNIDYFQITKVSRKSVWFRAVHGERRMDGTVSPIKDAFYLDNESGLSRKKGEHHRVVKSPAGPNPYVHHDRLYLSPCEWYARHTESPF